MSLSWKSFYKTADHVQQSGIFNAARCNRFIHPIKGSCNLVTTGYQVTIKGNKRTLNQMEEQKVTVSNSTTPASVKAELIELVNKQIDHSDSEDNFEDIILWISNTNGYISSYRYNADEELIDEEGVSFVLDLPELWEQLSTNEDQSFHDYILETLKDVTKAYFPTGLNKSVYQTWEINDHELLIEL